MRNVLSLLHRMIGPLVFGVAMATWFLLTDSLGNTLSYVKTIYTSGTNTYSEGSVDEIVNTDSRITGSELKALLNNGAAIGTEYYIKNGTDTLGVLTYNNTGFELDGSADMVSLFAAINDNYYYSVIYNSNESCGYTKATFTYKGQNVGDE